MIFTEMDEAIYNISNECHICEEIIEDKKDKVRDHCHITGLFRGAAHNSCNLNYKYSDKIPVFFHNLRGYDGHLILNGIKRDIIKDKKVSCIANNMEKYMSFTIGNLEFKDSLQFMPATLEKLVGYLDKNKLVHLRKHFKAIEKEKLKLKLNKYIDTAEKLKLQLNKNIDKKLYETYRNKLIKKYKEDLNEKINLLSRKGIFCYDYLTSLDVMNDTKLPSQDKFYNKLTKEKLSDVDYAYAKKVWEVFECKTFKDYHDLYLITDVLLLADVYAASRKFNRFVSSVR